MLGVGHRVEVRLDIMPWELQATSGDGAWAMEPVESRSRKSKEHRAMVRYVKPEPTVVDSEVGGGDAGRSFDE